MTSSCTTNRRSTRGPGGSSGSRRWLDGITRSSGWCRRRPSSRCAEETGLIVPLGTWVLDEACRQISEWSTKYQMQVPVAINLSAEEFTAKRIDARVSQALERNGLASNLLELEITESSFLMDLQAASATMHNLLDIGVRCSIDDFGTGYSGLRYLTQIPLHSLKIDQSFVQRIGSSSDEEQIVNAVITLARSLRMKVIAEGVETGDQATFLLRAGCDQMQGFLFSPALAPRDIERLLGVRLAEGRSTTDHRHAESVIAQAEATASRGSRSATCSMPSARTRTSARPTRRRSRTSSTAWNPRSQPSCKERRFAEPRCKSRVAGHSDERVDRPHGRRRPGAATPSISPRGT